MNILPHLRCHARASSLLLFCAILLLFPACASPDAVSSTPNELELAASCEQHALTGCESGIGRLGTNERGYTCDCTNPAEAAAAEPEPIDPIGEIGRLGQALTPIIYNSSFLYDGYGVEHPSPWRCQWPWDTCRVPKFKTIKIRVMPHDYDGCWGQFWTDAINAAIAGWNQTNIAFDTGFQFQTVSSGEHVRAWCSASGISEAGKTLQTELECSQWCWNGLGWIQCGLCKAKKWTLRLGGNNLVDSGCEYVPEANEYCAENIARHELGHVLGLAHHTGTSVMGQWSGSPHTQIQFPSNEELDFLWGYCPSGTSAHCN